MDTINSGTMTNFIPSTLKVDSEKTRSTNAQDLDRLPSSLIEQIFSFLQDSNTFFLNKTMKRLVSSPFITKIMIRNLVAKTAPGLVRWIESLRLSTTNWVAIKCLMQQPRFLVPTTKCAGLGAAQISSLSDGRLAFMRNKQLQILDPKTGTIKKKDASGLFDKISAPPDKVTFLKVIAIADARLIIEGKIAGTGTALGTSFLLTYDIERGNTIRVFEPGEYIHGFAVLEGQLVYQLLSNIQIRDLHNGQLQQTIQSPVSMVGGSVFFGSSNGLLAVAARNGAKINIWDLKTGSLKRKLIDEKDKRVQVFGITFDGTLLAAISSGSRIVRVWNIKTGEQTGQYGYGSQAALLPYGLVALTLCNEIRIVRITTGEQVITLEVGLGYPNIEDVQSLQDGRITAFSSGYSGTAFQYDQIQSLFAAATTPIPESGIKLNKK